ncbi:hypothetical protein B0A50_07720 [Salinomyces thailandicus]|uniref:Roadblock/LAMTOR2 domain-containing protein n=1 Tax=Salinomyces thailandicus TaxID=706561 RepID=A0A4U0TLK1_9PEZI|nr:hypothetical protein B0A50_07720 [Salinomyces thailandica]
MQQPSPGAETEALLARLSQRPGVQSTLILSRDTGAIVQSSGLVTAEESATEEVTSTADGTFVNPSDAQNANGAAAAELAGGAEKTMKAKKGTRQAEEVAGLVWGFMKSVGTMVEELNGENDEGRLVRVRTKKNEIVVVPDEKGRFLLVVVHDTPAA